MMEILKAKKDDIDRIEMIYEKIHDDEEKGLTAIGWVRNVYPVRKTAEESLKRDDLFVMVDEGRIVAAAIINQIQSEDYKFVTWKYNAKDDNVMVLHTLAVDPTEKNKGYGKAFVAFYEEYAKRHNCTELRMDTNITNMKAQKMYQKLGYEKRDIIKCGFNGIPNLQLLCLEKHLE